MLTPRNIVNYANPSSFNCGNEQQQLDFILHYEITKAQFEAIEAWFIGPNAAPASFTVSGLDMTNLIQNASCKTEAVVNFGEISNLGHAEISIALMTYQEIQYNTLPYYIGAYGTDLFAGLMKIKNADAFHFCKGTYTYSTNPNQKLNGVIFIATANGTPVYYADYMPL